MQRIINYGIYDLCSKKKSDEKPDDHPCLVIKTLMSNLYYVIPLVSFTEERWNRYKPQYACRIQSTDSIALISKMHVRHRRFFGKRFVSYKFIPPTVIVPSPDEIGLVLTYLNTYFYKSINDEFISYREYYKQYEMFRYECYGFEEMLSKQNFDGTIFNVYKVASNRLCLKIDDIYVGLLSGKDIQWVLNDYINKPFSVHHYNDYYFISIEI